MGLAAIQAHRGTGDAISSQTEARAPEIQICLLGGFVLRRAGLPLALRNGSKAESLLTHLALHDGYRLPRPALIEALWPESDAALASQCLNSLVYQLHKLLGEAIGGAAPVLHQDGAYRLNAAAGVVVDVAQYEGLVDEGERRVRAGDRAAAAASFGAAAGLYRGDLAAGPDIHGLLERERLRGRYLSVLAHLAEFQFAAGDNDACLQVVLRMLRADPCREDAHRFAMRCYVRRGERAQALRQYELCADILKKEFSATPEPATVSLFDQLRLNPESI